jgi:hypothetical protein
MLEAMMEHQVPPKMSHKGKPDPLDAPDVVWRRGAANELGWTFEPLIRVKPGTDVLAMLRELRDNPRSYDW